MKFAYIVLFLSVLGTTVAPAFQQQSAPVAKKKTAAPKKTVTRKTGTVVATKTAPASRTASAKTGAAAPSKKRTGTAARTSGKKGPVRTAYVPRQAAPSPDRYREIQQALAEKGYLKSQPTGVWDADSVAAMRQFQTDRKLEPSGKLTAAALIDLGLGPKTESAATSAPAAVAEPPKIETAPVPEP